MSKMDSVVHFEMPYEDRDRMAKFYQHGCLGRRWATMSLPLPPNLMKAVPRSQLRSMAASSRESLTDRCNIRPSSSWSMTSKPR
jgi:hypothetical protein